jgi:tRNA-splicing ligase RtcB (3'-phosphate/5'-hydroxy nucleic acid ligase)
MDIKQVSDNIWEIPKTGKMLVPGRVFASKSLLEAMKKDNTLQQVANVAQLKGIQSYSMAMPDAHNGYGFSIGGVAAFDAEEGIISPGGVGYDINCSVRLLRTNLTVNQILGKRTELIDSLFKNVPSGVGSDGKVRLDREMLLEVLAKGAKWAVDNGYGKKEDYEKTEESGCMKADPRNVSPRALQRGAPQLGSLGAGNHFLEIQKIDKVFDANAAKVFGIDKEGHVTIMIHCGSRGLGHQVASDYIMEMEKKYGFEGLPDRELINAPIQSELGQKYYSAMSAAANFAFANKQMITHWIRESINRIFGETEVEVVYDVCHNIAKMETHKIDGEQRHVCVHRKGATRSFGPGREEIPEVYRHIGQPIILPGSMGTSSYVLLGTKAAEELSFGSTAHGAGRVMSRADALRQYSGEQIKKEMANDGIELKAASWKGIAEESKYSYKDIDEVTKVSNELGIGKLVVRVKPVGVLKG